MIKIVTSLVSTAVGLALVLSFKSHTAGAPRSALGGTAPVAGSSSSGPVAGPGNGNAAGATSPSRPGTKKHTGRTGTSGTFTGDPIDTPYGTMQVAAVITDGKLTNVRVLRQTDVGGRSTQIDAQALPVLKSEALSAHSANIDTVSGATFTSEGYAKSLQSALAKGGM